MSNPPVGTVGRWRDQPLEEEVAERLMVAVELAVGRDDHERRLAARER